MRVLFISSQIVYKAKTDYMLYRNLTLKVLKQRDDRHSIAKHMCYVKTCYTFAKSKHSKTHFTPICVFDDNPI